MAPQPSSSSSGREMSENSELPYLNYVITHLCNSLQITIEDDVLIVCPQFVESVLEHVREIAAREKETRRLIGILHAHVQPRSSQGAARDGAHLQLANQSENNELVVDLTLEDEDTIQVLSPTMSIVSVPASPNPPEGTPQYGASPYPSSSPFCVISATYHIQTPEQIETDIPQSDYNDNHDNVITGPASSPTYTTPSLEEIGQPHEMEVGTSIDMVEDNLFQELLEPEQPQPSSSRQSRPRKAKEQQVKYSTRKKVVIQQDTKKPKKRARGRISNEEIHAVQDFKDGYYHCCCGSQFTSRTTQRRHVNLYNAEWKFACDHCTNKFYNLCNLKSHLEKQHGIDKPLKKYEVGCTLCGYFFLTRTALYSHKKTEHKINQGPRWPRRSPRRPWMTPSQREPDSSSSPRNPMLLTPRDEEIDVEPHINMHGLVSDDDDDDKEERLVERSPQSSRQEANISPFSPPQMDEQESNEGDMSGSTNGDSFLGSNSDKNYRYCCVICGEAFVSFFGSHTNMYKHMRLKHNSKRGDIQCEGCGMIFNTCQSFDQHWLSANH